MSSPDLVTILLKAATKCTSSQILERNYLITQVKDLINRDFPPEISGTAVFYAICLPEDTAIELLKLIILNKSPFATQYTCRNMTHLFPDGSNLLHCAVIKKYFEVVKLLVHNYDININAFNSSNRTALEYSYNYDDFRIMKFLLSSGAFVPTSPEYVSASKCLGYETFYYCHRNPYHGLLIELLQHYTNAKDEKLISVPGVLDIFMKNYNVNFGSNTPLSIINANHNPAHFKVLISYILGHGYQLQDDHAGFLALAKRGELELVKILIKAGYVPTSDEAQDKDLDRAIREYLIEVCQANNIEIIRQKLDFEELLYEAFRLVRDYKGDSDSEPDSDFDPDEVMVELVLNKLREKYGNLLDDI